MLGLVIGGISVAYFLGGGKSPTLPIYQQVGDFSLIDQSGNRVELDTLRGSVWVANIIFTRCGGPCPRLTRQMRELQGSMPDAGRVKFVSLTADPVFDTPQVLRRYADGFQADHARWFFLTGSKPEVYKLAVDELKFTVLDDERERQPDEDLFIHSGRFVVVDGLGRVRAYVEGDEPETVEQVKAAIRSLLKEKRQ